MFQSLSHRPVPVVDAGCAVPDVTPGPLDETFLAAAAVALPLPAADALDRLAAREGVGAVVLRNLPVGDLPPTPDGPTGAHDKARTSESVLLGIARRLGEPVGYLPEHGGDIVQNILPTPTDADRQTSTSSRVTLAFHTETAFHPHRPRYLMLLCLRGDPSASTTLCAIDEILPVLSPGARELLFLPRFHTRADESFGGGAGSAFLGPMCVLSGDPDHPTMVFDQELTTGLDPEAQAALDELSAAIDEHHTSLVLEPGDLLVVDNDRCVHGRSPFSARFDGTDRWLQRAFVVEDLAPSAAERDGRIVTTRFA